MDAVDGDCKLAQSNVSLTVIVPVKEKAQFEVPDVVAVYVYDPETEGEPVIVKTPPLTDAETPVGKPVTLALFAPLPSV